MSSHDKSMCKGETCGLFIKARKTLNSTESSGETKPWPSFICICRQVAKHCDKKLCVFVCVCVCVCVCVYSKDSCFLSNS